MAHRAARQQASPCRDESEPEHVDYDHPGYATFSAMIKSETQNAGAISVALDTQRIYFLRDDGTAHTMIKWGRGSQRRWYPESASICEDSDEWVDAQPAVSGPLTLDVGHCWIEPVSFDGRIWDVVEEDQFGEGGGHPATFVSTGTAWVAGDLVFYEDDSGKSLILVPEGDPWTIERKGCD